MRNEVREAMAKLAADTIRAKTQLPLPFKVEMPRTLVINDVYDSVNTPPTTAEPIGLVLGTGWGDVLPVECPFRIPLTEIPGFKTLGALEGHARELVVGKVAGRQVLVMRGRIHLNEAPADPDIYKMARLQVEMLLQLGARKLILTSAVGALPHHGTPLPIVDCLTGDICVIDGLVTVFAPDMPLWADEFYAPEDTLDPRLAQIALEETRNLTVKQGGHVMVRGPFFEGRKHDKRLLGQTGATVVGMSILPEACVAALYGARVLALGFVTNDAVETHSHAENLARAQAASAQLGGYLERIIARA